MRLKEIEEYKKTLKLTKLQRDILVGLILGDGHLATHNGGRTYKLKVEHSVKQSEYVDWLYEQFKEWVRTPPKIKYKNGIPSSYHFTTYSHGAFRFYAQQFYRDGKKILPFLIKKLLTPIGLAIWFMDDGSSKSNRHTTYVIHSIGYTKAELEMLKKVLDEKFHIKVNLHKQKEKYWRLYVLSQSVIEFRKNIEPYILPSLKYKLGNILPKE